MWGRGHISGESSGHGHRAIRTALCRSSKAKKVPKPKGIDSAPSASSWPSRSHAAPSSSHGFRCKGLYGLLERLSGYMARLDPSSFGVFERAPDPAGAACRDVACNEDRALRRRGSPLMGLAYGRRLPARSISLKDMLCFALGVAPVRAFAESRSCGRRRQDIRSGLVKIQGVPPDRAWWPAVDAPLERVRQHARRPRWLWRVHGFHVTHLQGRSG